MKRYALLTLGLSLTAAVGCGDEDSDESSHELDGGGTVAENWQDEIDQARDQVRGEIDAGLSGLEGELDDLTGRVDDLETPGSCSEGELCIPDGIDLVHEGFGPIIEALCGYEGECCKAGELKYMYGAAITDAASCVKTFTDMVNNGYAPSFIGSQEVARIIEVAHALNNTEVHVGINAAGVTACAEYITGMECPAILEPGGEVPTGCQPYVSEGMDYPCSLNKLLVGLEKAGDTCNPNSYGVPECEEGLGCHTVFDDDSCDQNEYIGGCVGQSGICAPKASVGDSCLRDSDCDDHFCNHATGKCQEYAKIGEACAYVDPTFEYVDPFHGYNYNVGYYSYGEVTTIDCQPGASCDPVSKKCVASYCAEGAFCTQNSQCPTGTVCNFYSYENLDNLAHGTCTAPAALGAECGQRYVYNSGTYGYENECESKRCGYDATDARDECLAALKPAGAACATASAQDASCESGYCGADSKCAQLCPSYGYDDDCADGQYCGFYAAAIGQNVCVAKLASGNCSGYHDACVSGFCDPGASYTCADKAALNGACPSGLDEQCQATQFCHSSGNCTTAKAIGADCTTSEDCGPDATCWDVDGSSGAGTVMKCYTLEYDLPDGTYCAYYDYYCQKGFCKPDSATSPTTATCAAPIAVGQPCDLADDTQDTCEPDAYCAYAKDSSAGTCKKQGVTGDACNPMYEGSDCLGEDCQFQHEMFVCGQNSVPEGEVFCHPGYYDDDYYY